MRKMIARSACATLLITVCVEPAVFGQFIPMLSAVQVPTDEPLDVHPSEPMVITASTRDHSESGVVSVRSLLISRVAPSSTTQLLQQSLLQAKNDLAVEKLPKIDVARSELEDALRSLEQFVQIGTTNGDNWSKFLRLPELHELIASQRPAYAKLLELEMNMRQNYLGLEYPQYTRLRDALGKYTTAARFYTQEDAFLRRLGQTLDETLNELEQSDFDSAKIDLSLGGIMSDLYQSNQSPQAVQSLHALFSQPNLRVTISGSVVDRLVSRAVSQPQDVDECILGTRVLGQAFMNGHVNANLLPMSGGVGIQLNLSACLSSQSRGYNRGVVLNTTSISPVLASKQVFFAMDANSNRVSTSPAQVSTNLQSTIHSIEHRLRIVRKIAARKAAEQKPQADAIAEQRMQSRISQEFSQQVDQQVSQAQQQLTQLRQQPRPELKRIGLVRPEIQLNSSSSQVNGTATHFAAYQMAAPQYCPLPQPASASVTGQVHQSAVNNAMETVLGGRVLRSRDLGAYAKQITGSIPEDLQKEIEGEEWSITFNPYRPIRIEFAEQAIKITLRIVHMTRGEDALREALSISTSYVPTFDGSKLLLTRQGEVTVTSDRQTPGIKATTIRSFMKNKFDTTFRESFETQPLNLNQFPQIQNLGLNFQQLSIMIDQGWLQVSIP